MSVARITDHGNTVTLTKNGATVRNEKDGQVKLTARRTGNLYYVGDSAEMSCAASTAKSMASIEYRDLA